MKRVVASSNTNIYNRKSTFFGPDSSSGELAIKHATGAVKSLFGVSRWSHPTDSHAFSLMSFDLGGNGDVWGRKVEKAKEREPTHWDSASEPNKDDAQDP